MSLDFRACPLIDWLLLLLFIQKQQSFLELARAVTMSSGKRIPRPADGQVARFSCATAPERNRVAPSCEVETLYVLQAPPDCCLTLLSVL